VPNSYLLPLSPRYPGTNSTFLYVLTFVSPLESSLRTLRSSNDGLASDHVHKAGSRCARLYLDTRPPAQTSQIAPQSGRLSDMQGYNRSPVSHWPHDLDARPCVHVIAANGNPQKKLKTERDPPLDLSPWRYWYKTVFSGPNPWSLSTTPAVPSTWLVIPLHACRGPSTRSVFKMRFGACHGICTTLVCNLYAQRMRVHDGELMPLRPKPRRMLSMRSTVRKSSLSPNTYSSLQ
jgi:hypothetical protein